MMGVVNKYPTCFPVDFEETVLPDGAKNKNIHVYRVIKSGILNRDSFIGTYEEILRKLRPRPKKLDLKDPGIYSTSCQTEYEDAEYMLNVFMRHYPSPFIAEGETEASCGPHQLTSERVTDRDTHSHVDWWVYEESQPHNLFKEVK